MVDYVKSVCCYVIQCVIVEWIRQRRKSNMELWVTSARNEYAKKNPCWYITECVIVNRVRKKKENRSELW